MTLGGKIFKDVSFDSATGSEDVTRHDNSVIIAKSVNLLGFLDLRKTSGKHRNWAKSNQNHREK